MKRRRRKTQIEGAFSWRLVEMLESPVMQVLNQSEHRALMRLEIELGHHGGTENGKLVVTFKAFKDFGIDRQGVAPSLRVLIALGIVEKTRQGSGGRTEYHEASQYRLTYRHTDAQNPTNEWRRVKTLDEAMEIAATARKAKDPEAVARSLKGAKKLSSGVAKPQIPGGRNHRSAPGRKSHPSIYISGVDTEQTGCEARPLKGAVASSPSSNQATTWLQIASAPLALPTTRLDILQSRVAAKLGEDGWSILQDLNPEDLKSLLAIEDQGSLDDVGLNLIRLQHMRGAA
jgi:hypothetical protein